jgi:hypothetical protein
LLVADTSGGTSLPDTRSALEKALRLIAEVRAGEGVTVLLLALNLFLVLTSYYMLKTIREALILTEGGAAVKTYSTAGQPRGEPTARSTPSPRARSSATTTIVVSPSTRKD